MLKRRFVTLFIVVAVAISGPPLGRGLSGVGAGTAEAATPRIWPVKIFAFSTPRKDVAAVLSNRYVAGLSTAFPWSAVEPGPGRFDWTQIDRAITQVSSVGKLAIIRVIAGIHTPTWVKHRVKTITISKKYLYNSKGSPRHLTMPVPWDHAYLSLWKSFVTAFGRRYNGNRHIYSVAMAGGGYLGEMSLPTDVRKWRSAGYTDAAYVSCWRSIISFYRAAFPNTHTNLGIDEPFGNALSTKVVKPVVAFATNAGPKASYIQNNGLRASILGQIGPYRQAIRAAASVTRVGYQMFGGKGTPQNRETGNRKKAFRVAIQDHASYVEVYASDILDHANAGALRYLARKGAP